MKGFLKQLKFDCFISRYIKLTKLCFSPEEVKNILDEEKITHLICGSDQIWNPYGMDAVYFLEYGIKNDNIRKIAYAASICSKEVMEQFKSKHDIMKHLINNIEAVSIREKSGVEIVKELTGRNAELVLDPTLLLNRNYWIKLAIKPKFKERYIICFLYGKVQPFSRKVNDIAKKCRTKKVIFIRTSEEQWCDKSWTDKKNVGPREFIGLLAYADAVCTDSFHGTAFSINLNRNVFCFSRSEGKTSGNQKVSNNSRLSGLLELLHIDGRWIESNTDIGLIKPLNYQSINRRLDTERRKSIKFLRLAIEGKWNEQTDNREG